MDDLADAVTGDVADQINPPPPECSCACCIAVSPSEVVDAADFVCSSRSTVFEPTATCGAECKLGCGSVLQATLDGVVQMQRFCLADCKPAEAADRAECTPLSADERAAMSTESGNGDIGSPPAP